MIQKLNLDIDNLENKIIDLAKQNDNYPFVILSCNTLLDLLNIKIDLGMDILLDQVCEELSKKHTEIKIGEDDVYYLKWYEKVVYDDQKIYVTINPEILSAV